MQTVSKHFKARTDDSCHSACITSILRAYYAAKTTQSHDISYNLGKMSLWSYAEVAIGTMVCCLPTLPKFFRHFGPKLYWSLPSALKSHDKSPQKLDCHPSNQSKRSENLQWHLAEGAKFTGRSKEWDKPLPTPARVTGEEFILDDFGMTGLGDMQFSEEPQERLSANATRREDLEKGQSFPSPRDDLH